MSFFSITTKKQINLILDISSGSVGGVFVLIEDGMVPLILSTSRKSFSLNSNFDSSLLEKNMLDAVDCVCTDLQKKLSCVPDKVFCVLSTPWSHGEVREIVYENKNEFVFNTKLANKLITEELEKFKKEWSGLKDVVDKKTTAVFLNGYDIDNPINQKARHLKIDVYFSLADQKVTSKIEEKIHKTFKNKIGVTSQMFVDYIVVRDAFDLKNDFIIINFGEEITEVSIMKNDHLIGTAFFPYGKNTMTRLVANILGKSLQETRSLFNLYNEGFIDKDLGENILKSIKIAENEWQKELHEILNSVLPNRHLPSDIFVLTEESSVKWFEKKMVKTFFSEFTTSQEDFNAFMVKAGSFATSLAKSTKP